MAPTAGFTGSRRGRGVEGEAEAEAKEAEEGGGCVQGVG